jgi:D-aminopeptidase
MSEAIAPPTYLAPLLALAPSSEDVMKGGLGIIAGTVGAMGVIIPKTVVDAVIWLFGDNRPASLVKGALDGGIGAWVMYHAATAKKEELDPFWRGAEASFAFCEILYGAITLTTTAMRYVSP